MVVALLGSCIAEPTHHVAPRGPANFFGRTRAQFLSAAGKSGRYLAPLDRRVDLPRPVRVVQFLRETISTAPAEDHDAEGAEGADLWNICLEHVSWFIINPHVPVDQVDNVAMKLERLYSLAMGVLWEIIETHDYPTEQEDNSFALRLGSVAIEWGCRGESLCWSLLYEFCLLMRQKASQGWTGSYDGQLVNAATGVITWVKLTIRGRGPGNSLVLRKRGTDSMPPTSRNSVLDGLGRSHSRRPAVVYNTQKS